MYSVRRYNERYSDLEMNSVIKEIKYTRCILLTCTLVFPISNVNIPKSSDIVDEVVSIEACFILCKLCKLSVKCCIRNHNHTLKAGTHSLFYIWQQKCMSWMASGTFTHGQCHNIHLCNLLMVCELNVYYTNMTFGWGFHQE